MDASADLQRYAWADTDQAPDGLALLFARPIPARPAAGLKIVSKRPMNLTLTEAQDELTTLDDLGWGSEYVQLDQLGEWGIFVSPWGWGTSLPEIVAAISRRGEAVSLFWNVNGVMSAVVAKDGLVVRSFDPLLYDDRDALPEEQGLPFGEPGACRSAALVMAERLTGQAIHLDWLRSRPRETFRIALPPSVAT